MSITEVDMHNSGSEVQKFYAGKTIFVTGASGFLGSLVVEKLLRSCPDITHIYILMREKKDKQPEERFKELFDIAAFDVLKSQQPDFQSKVSMLQGDLHLPLLGLSETSKSIIIQEVNCIFHIGATVRFDEALKKAAYINVRSTRDLLQLAKEMKKIESFVYVSTAYSNCVRKDVDEVFYQPAIGGQKLLDLVECLDENILADIVPNLLQGLPNTYVLTKAAAEDIIKNEAANLPTAIVRPSIVISSYKEPIPGWIDNLYGPTSILMGAALGLLKTLHGQSSYVADLVPVDFVINNILASAWDVAQSKKKVMQEETEANDIPIPKIYNYVSCAQNPITWGQYKDLAREFAIQIPSPLIIWHCTFNLHSNYYLHCVIAFLFQTIPTHIVDFLATCLGKKPKFVNVFKKIDKFCNVISFFTMNQWNFKNDNVQSLWLKMNNEDRELYNFDMKSMTWRDFFSTYILGARIHLLKDPLDTLPQGRRKVFIVKIAHYLLITVFCLLLLKLVMTLWEMC